MSSVARDLETKRGEGTQAMEFSVKKFDLLRELELTQGVVERKTTIPILSNLLIEAKGNGLSITATDLELSIRTSCEARVKKEGSGTIPAKKLYDIVRLLPEAEIKFKLLENHWIQVTCERKNYKLVGMSKENFPALPSFPDANIKIPAGLLAGLIAKTTFAISAEESRYTLNGALLVLKPASVTMVATDGHRLAMVEVERKIEGFSQETRVLIPKKAMTEIQRLAAESGEDVGVEFGQDESHLFFRFGQRLLTSRKLTGQFPNYEAVLPRDANKSLVLERGELQDALRRVSQLADLRTHAIRFVLANEGVEISASSPEYGEAKEALDKEYSGEPITIGFNAQYLLDFLAAAPDGPITFEMKDDQSASQLRPMADESSRYRYIVMPMRI
ncbi:MAG TPA: DNA polymerase III subunit beta [Candidatus Acidoferrales bacterium]